MRGAPSPPENPACIVLSPKQQPELGGKAAASPTAGPRHSQPGRRGRAGPSAARPGAGAAVGPRRRAARPGTAAPCAARSRCCISPGARSWRGYAARPSRCHGRSPLCSSGRRSSRSTPGLLTSGIKWFLLFGRSTCFLEISSWSCSLGTRLPSSHQSVEAESAQGLLDMEESEDVPKDFIKLKSEKLSVDEVSELVISPYCGAVSLFIGTTRNNFEGKKVIHLEYEAYTSMAETEIKKICRDVRQKWPSIKHIAVHHRLGVVPITEASVVIAASSPHRAESLEAVMYCINTLKASVPIWKKEFYEDEYSWKENKECFWANSEK